MTLTTLIGPSAVLISQETLTTAGSYSRTPPNGASYLVAKLRGAGGAIFLRASSYGGAGSGAYIQGMIPVVGSDAIILIVGAGGTVLADGSANEDGGGLSQVSKNGTSLMIAGGGGGASSYLYNTNPVGGPGGVINGLAGTSSAGGGPGGTQTSGGPQGYTDSTRLSGCGGYGYYPGMRATAAAGGGSSFIDPSVTHTSLSADGVYAVIGTIPGQAGMPGYAASPDFGIIVGQGAFATTGAAVQNSASGNDGGGALYWYIGDPYAAGLLS